VPAYRRTRRNYQRRYDSSLQQHLPARSTFSSKRAVPGSSLLFVIFPSVSCGVDNLLPRRALIYNGAMNRYPRLVTVDEFRFISRSPKIFRISRMYFLNTSGLT